MKRATMIVAVLALALAGCGGGGDEATADLPVLDDPQAEAELVIEGAGLQICDSDQSGEDISGAYKGATWGVGTAERPCSASEGDAGLVVLDFYNNEEAARARLESQFGDAGVSWLFDPVTVLSVTDASAPEVVDALNDALPDNPSDL
ncbi:MAG: hypothetical protein ACR2JF_18060 [Iamia sp.]